MKTAEKFRRELVKLGDTLKLKFPTFHWEFDEPSGVWLTKIYEEMSILDRKFLYRQDWRDFLNQPKLIIFADNDDWFGFTLD